MAIDRSLLHKATNGDDPNPTPGYMYGEIANMANESSMNADTVAKYISERLQKSNPFTKIKCLIITKQVCRKSASFRRAMHHRYVTTVKEHLQYRGPRHELLGDKLNQGVRDNAKEAVEAIFDTTPIASESAGAFANRITGFGSAPPPSAHESSTTTIETDGTLAGTTAAIQSAILNSQGAKYLSNTLFGKDQQSGNSPHNSGSYQSPNIRGGSAAATGAGFGGSGSKYGGIGNPNFIDPRNKPKGFLDKVKDRIEQKITEQQSGMGGPTPQTPGWMSSGSSGAADNGGSYGAPASGHSNGQYSAPSGTRVPGQVGGGWGNPSSTPASLSTSSHSTRIGRVAGRYEGTSRASSGGAASDGSYERSHIDALCSRGGVRAVPPADKLSSFIDACKTLDPLVVMPILEEKLEDSDWKVQHKALCVYEALVKENSCEAFADYIDDHSEILEELRDCKQASVRDRCKHVWVLLYGADPKEDNTATPAGRSLEPEPDLLGFGTDTAVESNVNTTQATEGVSDAPGGDLLGFEYSPMKSGNAMKQDSGASTTLFGGLTTKNSSTNQVDNVQSTESRNVQTEVKNQVAGSSDLLSFDANAAGGAINSAPVNNSSTVTDMFTNLNVQSETRPTPATGTAFGFINNSSPPTPPQPKFDGLAPSNSATSSQSKTTTAEKLAQLQSIMAQSKSQGTSVSSTGMLNPTASHNASVHMLNPTGTHNQFNSSGMIGIGFSSQPQQSQAGALYSNNTPSTGVASGGMLHNAMQQNLQQRANQTVAPMGAAKKSDESFSFVQDALANAT